MMTGRLICLVGPTRSGKTDLSLLLAERLRNVEFIYADSLAVYRYLDIGTDKPLLLWRQKIPHHLVDFLDPRNRWSAFDFKKAVVRLVPEILGRGNLPIVTGGSAFYLRTLWQSFTEGASADWLFRIWCSRFSNEQIFALLRNVDSPRAQTIGKNDRQRIIRAFKIFSKTGHPPSETKREVLFLLSPCSLEIAGKKRCSKKGWCSEWSLCVKGGSSKKGRLCYAWVLRFPSRLWTTLPIFRWYSFFKGI